MLWGNRISLIGLRKGRSLQAGPAIIISKPLHCSFLWLHNRIIWDTNRLLSPRAGPRNSSLIIWAGSVVWLWDWRCSPPPPVNIWEARLSTPARAQSCQGGWGQKETKTLNDIPRSVSFSVSCAPGRFPPILRPEMPACYTQLPQTLSLEAQGFLRGWYEEIHSVGDDCGTSKLLAWRDLKW